jgi:uncharacterized membrane protein
LAMLPARRPELTLLAIPGFAFSLLTTGYAPTLSIAFQYTCHTIPYLFAASVLMLRVMSRGDEGKVRRRAVLGAVALCVLSHSYVFGAVLQHNTFVGGFSKVEFTMTEQEKSRYQTISRMAAKIPESASVGATENEVPHVAARMDAFTLKDGNIGSPDFLLVRGSAAHGGGAYNNLLRLLPSGGYGLIESKDDLYLFKRGFVSPKTNAALSELGIRHSKSH